MNIRRVALALGFSTCCCANLLAGPIILPSDVSVALTAEPSVNLQSGQRITFTISVTNHGPQPVDQLAVRSSAIYDELDVFTASSSDCEGDIILAVVDLQDSFYYLYTYYAAFQESPLAVGETRICHLNLEYTQWAPAVFPVTFAMRSYTDLDPSNNSATVTLRRAVDVKPVPALSPTWLGLLMILLMATVWIGRLSRSANPPDVSAS